MADAVAHSAPNLARRDTLQLIPMAGATIGAGAVAWPLIDWMNPSAGVLALSSVGVVLPPIAEGMGITFVWQGKSIFVRHRTATEVKEAQDVPLGQLIAADLLSSSQGRPRSLDHPYRHLHSPRLRAAGQQTVRSARRVGRLVLPLPRQPVRHLRAGSARSGATELVCAPLRIRVRYQDQGRLTGSAV